MARRFRFNPSQKRDSMGRWTKGASAGAKIPTSATARRAAVVPYARTSLRSQTAGVNAGRNLSKNYRLSAGAYVRLERRTPLAIEKKISQTNKSLTDSVVKKLSPNSAADPFIRKGIDRARQSVVNKTLGKQVKIGSGSARLTTSRAGLPSVSLRKGTHKVSSSRSASAKADYNARMKQIAEGKRIAKQLNARPQRRRQEGRAA